MFFGEIIITDPFADYFSYHKDQHALVVFGLAGFLFWQWLWLIALMIACGYLGTKLGLKLLGKLPEKQFRLMFRIVLTLLALRLLWMNLK
ncbi:MAG: hypothetical protein ACFHVJ_09660 [Aestuariibacter sp.]